MTRDSKPKLTDEERHDRFKKVARQVGASEDPKEFDRAFGRVTARKPLDRQSAPPAETGEDPA